MRLRISLNEDDGTLSFLDEVGAPLPPKLISQVFAQQGDTLRARLEDYAETFNADTKRLAEIHRDTPEPIYRSRFHQGAFEKPLPQPPDLNAFSEPEPQLPVDRRPGIFTRLFPGGMEKHERKKSAALANFETAHSSWREKNATHDQSQHQLKSDFEAALHHWQELKEASERAEAERAAEHEQRRPVDSSYMGTFLEEELSKLSWPRETSISLEMADQNAVFLDVDLPEIEDFPKRVAALNANGKRINFKEKTEKALRDEYAHHVHGVGFRLAGVVFSILPGVETVVASSYSQRLNVKTGNIEDQYLYSVKIPRGGFSRVNFSRLAHVDPVEALAAFEIRRSITKTGIFKPIEPMAP